MKPDITIRLPHKEARKLLSALEKGVYGKLTPAQADTLTQFLFDFRCEVMEA